MMTTNPNAAVRFVDANAHGPRADRAAFVEAGGRSMTWRELGEASGRLAALYERHGVRREERALMLVLDQLEFPTIFWGSLKAGVVPIPLNTLLSGDVYRDILDDSRAAVLFVSHELLDVVRPALEGREWVRAVFVIGGEPPDGCHRFADELALGEARETLRSDADECAFWLYSSGSTGRPKGVRHVHASLGCTADTYGLEVLGIEPDDVVYSVAKLFFAYGLGNAMTFPMSVGATTVLLPARPTPAAVFDVLERHRPSVFCGVPTLYAALVQALDAGDARIDVPLRRCISAGEALPERIGRRWQEHTGCEILDGVGSTEMLHIFLSNRPGEVEYGTSGIAVPGYELRLVDETGGDVAPGEIGELLVKGGSAASDYWNQRAKSRATFEGAWVRSGDKYELAGSGRLVYCGRTDDMFKVSGIWLSPFELEQALVSHPCVLEAAVVAARDEQGLEKPKAFVVLNHGADPGDLEQALKAHVKERIGKWKYPRWIEIVPELPKTATGKIQRFKLREESHS